ncbi:cytochrome C biogenesis protein [Neorhizobium lilium]|uniref:Cytochrome C biogenesis protein n=2 Tax=Neorhizobium lilium TaxID=2503024 RepID=A0A444LGN3_9HYPH|nr:cytochrome C biogenesis protein [Neorhizobium lilium]
MVSGWLLVALPVLGLAAGPVRADFTPWATNEGGRMRLVFMPPEPDGKIRGALQIEPKPGWITYWKEPGDTGIPPKLSFGENSGISLDRVSYPVPKRIDNGALRDIGYDQPVAFPFELTVKDASKPVMLSASAFIGLCRNICIPFQADFTLALQPAKGTPVEEAMILNAATATLPEPPSETFALTHYIMTQGGRILRLTLRLPEGTSDMPQVIVSGPEGHILLDGINGRFEGDSYTLDMPVGKLPKGYEIKGKRWSILAIAGSRAMETSLAFD